MARARKVAAPRAPQLPFGKVIRVDPVNLGSVHLGLVAKCDDSFLYAIKDGKHDPMIPNTEWFCTQLAEKVGIPCVPCKILEMPVSASGSREYVFGSRWQNGELPRHPSPWYELVTNRVVPLPPLVPVLSWIYAFDHFVHNLDRHLFNFFVTVSVGDMAILAFDYSKAWTVWGFPLPPLPFDLSKSQHKTVITQRYTASRWGAWLESSEIDALLIRLRHVSKLQIQEIIRSHPKEWLPIATRRKILQWWKSSDFNDRIDSISSGIKSRTVDYV